MSNASSARKAEPAAADATPVLVVRTDQGLTSGAVYAALGPPVLQMLQRGHNASVFAYGQTGSGKTYTMLGTSEAPGLVPRLPAVAYLLQP